ncbi:hypothetical protein Gste01_01164 [Geobacillus stearothermophilus ATCC 7953]
MREMALVLAASFFFAVTFILNRSMELAGGSWTWSSSLRFFFMVPLLFVILLARRNLGPVWRDMKRHPWTWIVWETVGFGCFEGPAFVSGGGRAVKTSIYIDATKKFNISLTEKRFVHFRLSKASLWLAPSRQGVTEDRTTTCFTDPYMGL